jgi:hypothetical protein
LTRIHIDNVFTLQKARDGHDSDKTITVEMVANGLTADRASDEILSKAFDPETVEFHLSEGITDWHHQSDPRINKNPETCSQFIIGKPIDFRWEGSKPIEVTALTKAHPIVQSMLPNLEAGLPVYGASVGGDIVKFKQEYDKALAKAVRRISKIHWTHTAITGRPYVMSPGSAVTLIKAQTGCVDLLCLSGMEHYRSPILFKAMEASGPEGGTDIASKRGLSALQPQSMGEGEVIYTLPPNGTASVEISGSDWDCLMDDFLKALKNGKIPATEIGVIGYLQKQGFDAHAAIALAERMIHTLGQAVTKK